MQDWSVLLRPTPKRILEVLMTGPKSLGELAAATGLRKPSLLAHLRALEGLGAVSRAEERTSTGREVRFAPEAVSLHLEIRPRSASALSWAVAGETDELYPLTAQIPGPEGPRAEVAGALGHVDGASGGFDAMGVVAVVLFGSLARGEATWKSDIDLLFVLEAAKVEQRKRKLKDVIAREQPMIDRPVRPHFATLDEFLAGAPTLVREAQREGLIVHARPGEVSVWKRMAKYRRISI